MPIIIDGSGPISGISLINASVSSTELGYLDGVTSPIQNQIANALNYASSASANANALALSYASSASANADTRSLSYASSASANADTRSLSYASSASANANVYAQGYINAGRNLLYNGAMQVAQRGTSKSSITSSGYFTADRWFSEVFSGGTWTHSVENDAPAGSGFRKSFKTLCTTASASPSSLAQTNFSQRLEGQDLQAIRKGTSSAQQLTLSFWVKSNVTGTYIAEMYDGDNNRQISASYTISASATWERKTITFSADTTGAFDNDNAVSLYAVFWLVAGSNYTSGTLNTSWGSITGANRAVGQTNLAAATNNYWQVTGVQLEVGPIASPFQFKPYGQELAECQRYYTRRNATTANGNFGTGWFTTTTSSNIFIELPVQMRVTPTAIDNGGSFEAQNFNNSTFAISNLILNSSESTPNRAGVVLTIAGATANIGAILRAANSASAYVGFSAEL